MELILMFGGVCGVLGFFVSLVCLACVIGFTRSTHKIQYVPLKDEEILPPVSDEEDLDLAELKKVGRKKLISEADDELQEITTSDSLY
jgi:hypothetical protein